MNRYYNYNNRIRQNKRVRYNNIKRFFKIVLLVILFALLYIEFWIIA